ncbi:DegT/DnrJ/EryC1/StrS family aminotransferase [Haladaptatus halobius]|uniref:DegT/DnrJ/EryC1/StrS family aminotransferase n=1 Tax=Haladaptatus halobius TaxID=2884875 RepID=UPI001D0BD58D|nr:DegT/DnrJ/EryC1/StrS family aminotransferase [Haladaptatus halobius]
MIPLAAPTLGDAELDQIATVFERGQLTRGPEVNAFETEFATFCDTNHAIATANGTTALHTAFHALGLGESDRIATTPFSFIASANAIRWCGATPTFVDIRADTYNIDCEAFEQRLRDGEQIDAVLAVHAFGLPCEMDYLRELSDEHDFLIIEDAAQAHSAQYNGEPVGSLGDAACFSFFASKNMTTGEGGMVVTDDSAVAERARSFIEHGKTEDGYDGLGHNFCMSDVTAAIGRAQLEKLPGYTDARRQNAQQLTSQLEGIVETPVEPANRRHVYHIYTIQTEQRDSLRTHLTEHGVATGVYYETPIHRQPAYRDHDVQLPTADRLSNRVLALPVHPHLAADELDQITTSVHEYVKSRRRDAV